MCQIDRLAKCYCVCINLEIKPRCNLCSSQHSQTVLAEGIETAEQYEFLKARGCDEAQGYLMSRPIPAEQFTALLGEGQGFLLPKAAAAPNRG